MDKSLLSSYPYSSCRPPASSVSVLSHSWATDHLKQGDVRLVRVSFQKLNLRDPGGPWELLQSRRQGWCDLWYVNSSPSAQDVVSTQRAGTIIACFYYDDCCHHQGPASILCAQREAGEETSDLCLDLPQRSTGRCTLGGWLLNVQPQDSSVWASLLDPCRTSPHLPTGQQSVQQPARSGLSVTRLQRKHCSGLT